MNAERDDDEVLDDAVEERRPWGLRRGLVHGVLAVALVAVGVVGGMIWSARPPSLGGPARDTASDRQTPGLAPRASSQPSTGMPDVPAKVDTARKEVVEVTLTPDAVERAGIKTAVVRSESAATSVTVPATVSPNAYADTKVHAVVGGIVRQVSVELGAAVERGQPLAVIFSAELADAQMKYLSMRAMLEADHQKLIRTEKLVSLGAASRQELEEVTAVHAGHETEVAAARQRLVLLGLSPAEGAGLTEASQVVAEVTIPAPSDGIVTLRQVNRGQVVGAGQELFTVTDLRTVWVIGDLYEKDFAGVRVGSNAVVTVPALSRGVMRGRVAYIDARVDPATRTAKVRVEVPNRAGELRLGMYVTVAFETLSGARATLVPREAVQMIGERSVVYVPVTGEEGRFTERVVTLGPDAGDALHVLDGLKPGERIVVAGAYFLRAEAGRTRAGD